MSVPLNNDRWRDNDITPKAESLIPFHTFLWKISSRCNINCSYCYIYNLADSRWQAQPHLMGDAVAKQTATRMRQHCEAHDKHDIRIVCHGGEPLLGGVRHLDRLTSIISEEFKSFDIKISIGMQSNALLFDEDIGKFLLARGMSMGVSLDGPPHVNDLYRVDHMGGATSAALEERLRLLTSQFDSIFSGFLCVINPDADPVEVTDYLLSWNPPSIDFLFPLDHHDRLPRGKTEDPSARPYGQWLIQAFEHWLRTESSCRIRIFNSIIELLCGEHSPVESLGVDPVDLIVVETNGSIEGVDSLKATFDGATFLGMNVFEHAFDDVARHLAVRSRQIGAAGLCETCQKCPIVQVCGGGYIPHRYSHRRGFDNPSVYCTDLDAIIRHIYTTLRHELELSKEVTV